MEIGARALSSKWGTARHASPGRGSGAIFTRIVSPRSPRVVVADGPLEKDGTACRVKGECVVADAVEEPTEARRGHVTGAVVFIGRSAAKGGQRS